MQWLPPQISRLVALTLCIVIAYFVARHFLVPPSFGQYGWYRGDALKELADRPIVYAGRKACIECHADIAEKITPSRHAGISCESCHGAGARHAEAPGNPMSKITDERFCLRCHRSSPSLPPKFPQVNAADHYSADQPCMDCHLPHSPAEPPP